jgi:hypothetical protein
MSTKLFLFRVGFLLLGALITPLGYGLGGTFSSVSPSIGVQETRTASRFFVAPHGTPAGNGRKKKPWDLATALSHPPQVLPGDTIFLRGGTYSCNALESFRSQLSGELGSGLNDPSTKVHVRAFPGERVTIDASGTSAPDVLRILGQYTWFWDLEITNSDTRRTQEGVNRAAGVTVLGAGIKLLHLVVHDTGQGIFAPAAATDLEIYGCLIYYSGRADGANGALDHSLYLQNQTGLKKVRFNVALRSTGFGVHCFTSAGFTDHFLYDGNVIFDSGAINPAASPVDRTPNYFVGGSPARVQDITLRNNVGYYPAGKNGSNLHLAYGDTTYNDLICTDNYLVGGNTTAAFRNWESVTFARNFVYGATDKVLSLWTRPRVTATWDDNEYWFDKQQAPILYIGAGKTFAEWRAETGYDSRSIAESGRPPSAQIIVTPARDYEPGRGIVTIINWPLAPIVKVDLSPIVAAGASYEIRDSQNYYGPVIKSGVYGGGKVKIRLGGHSTASPAGLLAPGHLGPEFNCFLVKQL